MCSDPVNTCPYASFCLQYYKVCNPQSMQCFRVLADNGELFDVQLSIEEMQKIAEEYGGEWYGS